MKHSNNKERKHVTFTNLIKHEIIMMDTEDDTADNSIRWNPGDIDEEIETYIRNTEMVLTEFDEDEFSELLGETPEILEYRKNTENNRARK